MKNNRVDCYPLKQCRELVLLLIEKLPARFLMSKPDISICRLMSKVLGSVSSSLLLKTQ